MTTSHSMMPVSDAFAYTENDIQHQEGQQLFCQQKKKKYTEGLATPKSQMNKTRPVSTKMLIQPMGITVCQKLKPLTMTLCP